MIKIKKVIITVMCFAIILSVGISAGNNSAYDWYCKRNGNEPPALEQNFEFIRNYGGYYIDEKAAGCGDKVIYLTFDAGYENGNVERILDALDKHNAKGAFFVLDNLIISNTDLVKRMADGGHLVCNHTAKHRDMTTVTNQDEFRQELEKLEGIYKEYTGCDMPKYYRPPEGKFSEANLEYANELGYKTIFWSFAYADWDNNAQMSCDSAKEKIISNTHCGEIILLHPTSKTNADILDELLCEWEKMGYRFGTLDELVG